MGQNAVGPGPSKLLLRERIRAAIKGLDEPQRTVRSDKARQLLEQQIEWKKATRILFYAPLPGELDVWPLFEDAVEAGKEAYLPRFVAEKPLERLEASGV